MIHGYYWQINVTAHCYGLFLSVEGTTKKLNAIFNSNLVNKHKTYVLINTNIIVTLKKG